MNPRIYVLMLTASLLASGGSLRAQDPGLGFYITGGYTQHQWNPEPFNAFAASYNEYLAGAIDEPLEDFSSTLVGFQRGFGGYYFTDRTLIGFEFFKSEFKNTRTSSFQNGRGNEIELNFIDWQFSMDFGRRLGRRLTLSALIGTGLRAGVIDVRILHFDGSPSLGNEFYFAGVYRSGFQSDWLLGAQARFHLLPFIDLQARIYKTFRFFDSKSGEALGAFEDSGAGQLISATYFPADYEQYEINAENGTYDFENNIIPMNFRGFYINVGVAITIKSNDEN